MRSTSIIKKILDSNKAIHEYKIHPNNVVRIGVINDQIVITINNVEVITASKDKIYLNKEVELSGNISLSDLVLSGDLTVAGDTLFNGDVLFGDTYWDDMLGPLTGSRLDSASGRINFNYFNGAVEFEANARYPEEPVLFRFQLPHGWKIGTNARPHIHWKQQHATNIPNWLLAYKVSSNGDTDIIESDFSNFSFSTTQSNAFEYSSGVLNQISSFEEIDLSTAGLSDNITVALFRDSTNISTRFSGNDPSALGEFVTDLDCHIQKDTIGSDDELVK